MPVNPKTDSFGPNKFLYVDKGKSFLCIDQARQYCFMTDEGRRDSCKVLNNMQYVCEQNQPIPSFHLHEKFMVKLLQPRGSVPAICGKRIVEFSNPIWTQLLNNEWIYSSPRVRALQYYVWINPLFM